MKVVTMLIFKEEDEGGRARVTPSSTGLDGDNIIQIRRLSKDFVSKTKYVAVDSFFNFEPVWRFKRRGYMYMRGFRRSEDGMSEIILYE